MKYPNIQNPVLLEGLWGAGKTAVAKSFSEQYGYSLVPEPSHLDDPKCDVDDLRSWYMIAHEQQEPRLGQDAPCVMERSVLSTYAFDYALHGALPEDAGIRRIRTVLQSSSVLLVYLKPAVEMLSVPQDFFPYSGAIRSILQDPSAVARYHQFYQQILPWEYGIVPLILEGFDLHLRSSAHVATEIRTAMGAQRVAQVNVICIDAAQSSTESNILLLHRTPLRGGFWQAITGGMHPGELLSEVARREVKEEIGVLVPPPDLIPTRYAYSFPGGDGYLLHEYVFVAQIHDRSTVHYGDEHDDMRWVPFDEAMKLLAYETNREAVRRAMSIQ